MAGESPKWDSFWDIAVPEAAARVLADLYGPAAAEAAAWSGIAARADGREEDYRFWFAVFARLRAGGRSGMARDARGAPGPRRTERPEP